MRNRSLLILAAAAIVALLLAPWFPPLSFGLWVAVGDAAHFPLLGGLALLLLFASRDDEGRPSFRLVVAVGCGTAIAIGSGLQIQDVNRLLKQFTQMEKMMRKMARGGMKKMMRGMPAGGMPPGMR